MYSKNITFEKHWRGGHSPLLCGDGCHRLLLNGDEGVAEGYSCVETKGHRVLHTSKNMSFHIIKKGFTLAEVLITLGVIGVVAAVTMPTLVSNVQERIKKEQVRTVKYKLTKATDSMKSLDKIAPYATTEAFVNELKKHMSIAKICDNDHLSQCWPTTTINLTDGTRDVNDIKKGTNLMALSLGTGSTTTMGIVTGDGVPMILVYSPVCNPLDPVKSYTWSVVDGKPETNATTNCISAIFDINGAKGPNKIGQDVRTLNSLFGYRRFTATAMSKADCEKNKDRLGINACGVGTDYWAGAVKACADIGLHLPSMQTLANLAGARYGRTDIGVHTLIMRNGYSGYADCHQYYDEHDSGGRKAISDIICVDGSSIPDGANTAVSEITDGDFWSSTEVSASTALKRGISSEGSSWYELTRDYGHVPLCVGD